MTATPEELSPARPLPAWRLAAGTGILAGMLAVLLWLSPWYVRDYGFKTYMRNFAAKPATASLTDDGLRAEILSAARDRDLPLNEGNVKIARSAGAVRLETSWAVHLKPGEVDLHFHESATAHSGTAALKDNQK